MCSNCTHCLVEDWHVCRLCSSASATPVPFIHLWLLLDQQFSDCGSWIFGGVGRWCIRPKLFLVISEHVVFFHMLTFALMVKYQWLVKLLKQCFLVSRGLDMRNMASNCRNSHWFLSCYPLVVEILSVSLKNVLDEWRLIILIHIDLLMQVFFIFCMKKWYLYIEPFCMPKYNGCLKASPCFIVRVSSWACLSLPGILVLLERIDKSDLGSWQKCPQKLRSEPIISGTIVSICSKW